MGVTGHKGVDVRQTTSRLIFRASLKDSAGAVLTSGTTSLRLYELQDDGTLKSYDFNDNTFKTTALTTATASMTHRQGNNSTVNTGLWTYVLGTVSGFTKGAIYFATIENTGASAPQQEREFQFGGVEGDAYMEVAGIGDGGTEFMPVDSHRQDFDGTTPGELTTFKPNDSTPTTYSPKTATNDPAANPITSST